MHSSFSINKDHLDLVLFMVVDVRQRHTKEKYMKRFQ